MHKLLFGFVNFLIGLDILFLFCMIHFKWLIFRYLFESLLFIAEIWPTRAISSKSANIDQGVSPNLTWHALVHLYKGYLCKALPSVAEGLAYALRGGPVFNNQPTKSVKIQTTNNCTQKVL